MIKTLLLDFAFKQNQNVDACLCFFFLLQINKKELVKVFTDTAADQ